MIIVSACLAGENCRYDGSNKLNKYIQKLVEEGDAISLCPEQLGGLPTPRIASEQKGGRVFNKNGEDVTEYFVKGAEEVLRIANLHNCKDAVLKSKSPSCGCGQIYDGFFSGKLIKGDGITTALLKKNKIEIYTEEDYK